MYHSIVLAHVLAATIWVGGHLVLAVGILPGVLRSRNLDALLAYERQFERIGIPALVVQIVSGISLALYLRPNISDWLDFHDPVSAQIMAKLVLLGTTLALGLHARFRLIPKLTSENLGVMALHIVAITVVAVLFVVVGLGFRFGAFAIR